MRSIHDMGGLSADSIQLDEHQHAPWEKQTDALLRLLSDQKRRLIRVDELRRGVEGLGPGAYQEMSYYERWIASITQLMIEKGVITIDELGKKMTEVQARHKQA